MQGFKAVSKELQKKSYTSQADVIRAMGIGQVDPSIDQQVECEEVDISDSEDDEWFDCLSHDCSATGTSEDTPVHPGQGCDKT